MLFAFARYLGARDKGLLEFAKFHYEPVDGDPWAATPEVVLFSGAMLRPGIETTLKEFERREGCRITTVYNGCGILTAQMRAGSRPDAYFSCDTSFMNTVADLYVSPLTDELAKLGARIFIGHRAENVGEVDVVLITSAVQEDNPEEHTIHKEYGYLSPEVANSINLAKKEGRRVFCVGTTSVRIVETAAQKNTDLIQAFDGWVDLFILPGHKFRVADAMITNFHLPKSTLMMLVSAFAGKELIDKAYKTAITEKYRFYSFGDAMLIL